MSLKKIISCIICIFVIILIIISTKNLKIFNKTSESNIESKYGQLSTEEMIGAEAIKSEISEALEKCKTLYKESNDKNEFYTCFKIDFINDNILGNNKMVFIEDIEQISFEMYDIYNSKNELLSNFPYDKVENVSKDNLVIEPNQDFIAKVFCEEDNITYYFLINISENGEYTIDFICYTYGEIDESKEVLDENTLKMWENVN